MVWARSQAACSRASKSRRCSPPTPMKAGSMTKASTSPPPTRASATAASLSHSTATGGRLSERHRRASSARSASAATTKTRGSRVEPGSNVGGIDCLVWGRLPAFSPSQERYQAGNRALAFDLFEAHQFARRPLYIRTEGAGLRRQLPLHESAAQRSPFIWQARAHLYSKKLDKVAGGQRFSGLIHVIHEQMNVFPVDGARAQNFNRSLGFMQRRDGIRGHEPHLGGLLEQRQGAATHPPEIQNHPAIQLFRELDHFQEAGCVHVAAMAEARRRDHVDSPNIGHEAFPKGGIQALEVLRRIQN